MQNYGGRAVAEANSSLLNRAQLEKFFENISTLDVRHEILKHGENPLLSWFKYTGYIQPHKYTVYHKNQVIGSIAEQVSSKILFFIVHIILNKRRPLRLILQDNQKSVLLAFHRPFYIWLSQLYVKDSRGNKIGCIQKKFSFTHKKYHLFTNRGRPFGFIKSFFTKFWTFPIINAQKQSIGEIKKKWGGGLKEILTEADHFIVQLSNNLSLEKKAVILSAAVTIDFDHFETDSNN